MSAAPPVLEVREVVKSYDGICAVAGASFDVARGSLTALVGPNGAGKTTVLDVLSGFARPDAGTVQLGGRSIAGMAPHRIARIGLVRTFQLTRVLSGMSVLDNMLLAAPNHPGEDLFSLVASQRRAIQKETSLRLVAEELLETLGLRDKAREYAGSLSGGQRKMLEFGRALMAEPSFLLLDEPLEGVAPPMRRVMLDRMAMLRRIRGMTMLFVEHDMDVVMNHADSVIVMAQGKVIANGPPAGIRADPAVLEAYLGRPAESAVL